MNSLLYSCTRDKQTKRAINVTTNSASITKDSILIIENLPAHFNAEWDSLYTHFLDDVYEPYFAHKDIHFDCDRCEHVAMTLTIGIDKYGNVLGTFVNSEYIHCDKLSPSDILEMKRLFINYFKHRRYPKAFFGQQIQFTIRPRRILKC
jgi:hypothetical protein